MHKGLSAEPKCHVLSRKCYILETYAEFDSTTVGLFAQDSPPRLIGRDVGFGFAARTEPCSNYGRALQNPLDLNGGVYAAADTILGVCHHLERNGIPARQIRSASQLGPAQAIIARSRELQRNLDKLPQSVRSTLVEPSRLE